MKPAGTEPTDSQSGNPGMHVEMEKISMKRKNTLIFACSSLSNTGKLMMQAASALAFRRPDMYWAAAAHKGVDAVEDAPQTCSSRIPIPIISRFVSIGGWFQPSGEIVFLSTEIST